MPGLKSWSVALSCSSVLPERVNELWTGCQHYYYRCLARAAALTNAMATPSKVSAPLSHASTLACATWRAGSYWQVIIYNFQELSVRDIDRCKGITQHLLHLAHVQRRAIATVSQNMGQLRFVNRVFLLWTWDSSVINEYRNTDNRQQRFVCRWANKLAVNRDSKRVTSS